MGRPGHWLLRGGARLKVSPGPVCPSPGSAGVYVDGIDRTTVSLDRSTNVSGTLVYVESFRASGSHRIELRVASSGRVEVDAFVILR